MHTCMPLFVFVKCALCSLDLRTYGSLSYSLSTCIPFPTTYHLPYLFSSSLLPHTLFPLHSLLSLPSCSLYPTLSPLPTYFLFPFWLSLICFPSLPLLSPPPSSLLFFFPLLPLPFYSSFPSSLSLSHFLPSSFLSSLPLLSLPHFPICSLFLLRSQVCLC